jgi:hypothetical protein
MAPLDDINEFGTSTNETPTLDELLDADCSAG